MARRKRHLGGGGAEGGGSIVQGGSKFVGRLKTLLRILLEAAQRDLLERRWYRGVSQRRPNGAFLQLLQENRRRRLIRERHFADEHLVQDDAERVDIAARIDSPALDLLGRHVVGRAERAAGARELRRLVEGLGDAEVDQLRELAAVRAGREHDVLRLQVAVDDVVLVRRGERAGNLAKNRDGAGQRDRVAGLNQRFQA